jgi:hypothetical protein
MTRDSGSERPQRTVAELLAEYGGNAGDAPRRRRRRAEDDDNSAPKTIIDRVLSDSGKLLPIKEDQPPAPPRRPGGHRSGEHRPPAQPSGPPPAPSPQVPAGPVGGPPPGPPTGYAEPVRPQGPPSSRKIPRTTRAPQAQPPQPAQPSQAQPQPSQPQQAPQFPPSRPAMPPVGQSTAAARPVPPPAGPPSRSGINPVTRQQAAPRQQRPPAPPIDGDNAVTAVHPPLPDDFDFPPAKAPGQPGPGPQGPGPQQTAMMQPTAQPPTAQPPTVGPPTAQPPTRQPQAMQPPTVVHPPVQRPGGLPPEATTEEFPLVGDEPPAPLRPAPPSGRGGPPATQLVSPVGPASVPPGRRSPVQPPDPGPESTQAHPFVDDDYDDGDFPPGGVATGTGRDAGQNVDDYPGGGAYTGREEYDDDLDGPPVSRVDDFADADDEPASAREWILMAGQVGAGALAGAAVWLAFSWLWGMLPVVAVVAALLVIVGLVLGVRRWRRADDLQTTVLAILAGLVVTVSPAALLLLRR